MSTVYWDDGRPFPSIIHIRRDGPDGSEVRHYIPMRTFHVVEHEKRYGMKQTLVIKMCSVCFHVFGSERHREFPFPAIVDEVEVPEYCPGCGSRLEVE